MRIKSAIFALSVFLFNVSNAYAENQQACGSILCLAGAMKGSNPSECNGYNASFFSIKKFKKGRFKANWTESARADYLNQCTSADVTTKNSIISRYGRKMSL